MRNFTQPCRAATSLRATLRLHSALTRNSRLSRRAPIISVRSHGLFSRHTNRPIHTSSARWASKNESSNPPPTDLNELDVLGNTPPPSTSVDVCMYDGFGLNSGVTISGGNGALLVNGEAFAWRPWEAKGSMELANKKGQFDIPVEAFGVFDILWPRPDLLIIGVGKQNMPLSPQTRQNISSLGIRVEVLDTRNAAAQFNLLATERGVSEVAAALIPIGWKDGEGAK